jgi:hypothetical protein
VVHLDRAREAAFAEAGRETYLAISPQPGEATGGGMEYATSLLLGGQPLHAREVGYEDCREFQIICLACHEPVFKVGSEITKRQYFAHYKRQMDSACELRVTQIVRQHFDPKPVLPKGQELDSFLRRFEQIILEACDRPDVMNAPARERVRRRIDRMRNRPAFRKFVFIARTGGPGVVPYLPTMALGLAMTLPTGELFHPPSFIETHPGGPERKELTETTLRYLLSPNSFRALMFAICLGLDLRRRVYETDEGFVKDDTEIFKVLRSGSDRDFAAMAVSLKDAPSEQLKVFDKLLYALFLAVGFFTELLTQSASGPHRLGDAIDTDTADHLILADA